MLQIHQLVEGLFPAQHQGEGTDEKGTEPQAHHDQGQVAGDGEGTDGAIKAEGGIKQLEVDQAHQSPPGRQTGTGLLLIAKGLGQGSAE